MAWFRLACLSVLLTSIVLAQATAIPGSVYARHNRESRHPDTHIKVKSNSKKPKSNTNPTQTSSSDINTYLTAHNTVRAKHGAVNLTWNADLATAAHTWAAKCVWKHSGGELGPYGENLAAGYTIEGGVAAWAGESYDPNNPVPSHFTQVVWKGTTELGCAVVSCAAGTIFEEAWGPTDYMVCEYSPPGNVIGEFAQNVQA